MLEEAESRLMSAAELEQEAAGVLSRPWVVSRMMKAAQICLGEVKIMREIQRKVRDKQGQDTGVEETVEVEARIYNLPAANQTLSSLAKELDRQTLEGANTIDGTVGQPKRAMDVDKMLASFHKDSSKNGSQG